MSKDIRIFLTWRIYGIMIKRETPKTYRLRRNRAGIRISIRHLSVLIGIGLIWIYPSTPTLAGKQFIDSLKNELEQATDTQRVDLLNQLSREIRFVNSQSSLAYAEEAMQLALQLMHNRVIAESYFSLGVIYQELGEVTKVLHCFEKCIELFDRLGMPYGVCNSHTQLGYHYRRKGNFDSARYHYNKAFAISDSLDDKHNMARLYNNVGIIYQYEGNYSQAMEYFIKSLKVKEELGDKHGAANTYGNIAGIHHYQKEFDEALKMYKKVLAIFQELENKRMVGVALNSIGYTLQFMQRHREALQYYDQSLTIKEALGDKYGIATTVSHKANIYLGLEKYDSALIHNVRALELRIAIDDQSGMSSNYLQLGIIHRVRQEYRQAEINFLKALELAEKTSNTRVINATYKELAKLYEARQAYGKSLKYLKLHAAIKDSLFDEEQSRQIKEMESKYENEKKAREIALLNKDKELQQATIDKQRSQIYAMGGGALILILLIIGGYSRYHFGQKEKFRRQQAFLQEQLSELEQKALRSQMKPDFIFECMHAIQALMTSGDIDRAINYLTKFAKLLRQVLEHSLETSIELSRELETLKIYLELEQLRTNHKFDFNIDIQEELELDFIFFPPLLIQPFVEKAIWENIHHKDGSGKIDIELKSDDPAYILCHITDNGIGSSGANSLSEDMGTAISQNRMEIMQKDDQSAINVVDLFDHQKMPCGTRVEIKIPA